MSTANPYSKILKTIVLTGMAFLVNYLITFFLAPYITEHVGTEAYGFVSLAKDMALYATYITIALNSHASRFISVEYHRGNLKQANVYFSSVFWGDMVLGTAVFVVALVGIWNLDHLLQIPPALVPDVKLLFLFVFIKFWLVTIDSVFASGAYVANKLDLTGFFKGLSYCAEAASLLILFRLFNANVYFVGIGLLGASVVIVISDFWIYRRYTGDLHIRKKDYSLSAVKTLVVNGVWSAVSSLGQVLNSGLDLMVCNLMLTPLAMGQLAITESILTIFGSLYTMVSESFKPYLLKIYAENNIKRLVQEFKMAIKFSGFLSNLFFAGFVALGLKYYELWIPNEDIGLIFTLTIMSVGSSYLVGLEYPLFFIYTLTLTRKVSCMFTLITGFLNVISMYVLIKFFHMGVYAVVGTTLVLQTFIHLIPHPLYMAHVLRLPWHTFYPDIFRGLFSLGVMCLAFWGLTRLYMPTSWLTLFGVVPLYALVGLILHVLIVFRPNELKHILASIHGLKENKKEGKKV